MTIVYLGLGTNLGERAANLRNAQAALEPAVKVLAASSVYETEPWGYKDQPSFLNQVLKGETRLPPQELLDFLKNLETQLGREVNFRYGPRLIDIDILFYGRQVIESNRLQIPHPRLHERAFVLVPLAEISPGLVHPLLRKTVRTLLATLENTDEVRPWG